MWSEGTVDFRKEDGSCTTVHYWMKHFEEGSIFGIRNGKISKLMLRQDETVVYNYDRGLDVKPQTAEAKKALALLLREYN